LFGRGFDSLQLHNLKENNHPRKGVFVFEEAVASSLALGRRRNKKTMRSMVVVFIGVDEHPYQNSERSEHPLQIPLYVYMHFEIKYPPK
jgi:hypothetical protein